MPPPALMAAMSRSSCTACPTADNRRWGGDCEHDVAVGRVAAHAGSDRLDSVCMEADLIARAGNPIDDITSVRRVFVMGGRSQERREQTLDGLSELSYSGSHW